MAKIRVFISSVQRELEAERQAVKRLLTLDPSLGEYFTPILYEHQPASNRKATEECVDLVESCQVFILIVGRTAGFMVDDKSITHLEFARAARLRDQGDMKIIALRKDAPGNREDGAEQLLGAVGKTGVKYATFSTPEQFDSAVQSALRKALSEDFGGPKLPAGPPDARAILAAASQAENGVTNLTIDDIDMRTTKRMLSAWDERDATRLSIARVACRLCELGHAAKTTSGDVALTLAGAVVLARDPASAPGMTSYQVSAEAYAGTEVSGHVLDQKNIRGHASAVVDGVLSFIHRNTRHPTRVVGARRIELDEYPSEALREAIVNALAHRSYDDTGARVIVRVFSDRVVVASPGGPPGSLTITRLKSGKAYPIARNPLIAQSLFNLGLMEHRGSGFKRMQSYVGTSGLQGIDVKFEDGYLALTLTGPGEAIDALPLPQDVLAALLPPSRVDGLNERQKEMASMLVAGVKLTSRACEDKFGVTRDTTAKDFKALVAAGVAVKVGAGRSVHYVLAETTG